MLPERLPKSFRLSSDAVSMLAELRVARGISQAALLEAMIRDEHRRRAVDLKRVRRAKAVLLGAKP